ncbi:transforming growth factor-beta receptor-associated protein 1 isoform X2 [Eucyclogobius newberryi]|uniref:transforming growth factor-beta receptor-associated protein 1 isoform X2 n=1 Tax=Eucyclogobius newberryi TaxID=166745 RepID=UPI003B5930CB
MAFEAFTFSCVYEKTFDPREKDKFNIQCLESFHTNIYIGTKQGTVHHLLLLPTNVHPNSHANRTEERRAKKLSNSTVNQIRLVPIYSHLLVLSNCTVAALNMFSLETNPSFKKIQNVSQFDVLQRDDEVRMVTCSGQKKAVRVLSVGPDRWDVLREMFLVQEPVVLALDGASVCVGTSEQYLLWDVDTGHREDLFQHGHSRQQVLVSAVGGREFLLNGPGGLGLFVTASGVCQRPPLHWPPGVLAARAFPPFALSLQAHELAVYSLLDQQCKQTVRVSGALGLAPAADGAVLFTDRAVYLLCSVPLQEQVLRLMEQERLDEALLLLESEHSQSLDPHGELLRSITHRAGFNHLFQEKFTEATELFIKGELDPRELLHLLPELHFTLPGHFHPKTDQTKTQGLRELWRRDPDLRHRFLGFLTDFLRVTASSARSCGGAEVDCALLWLHVQTADSDSLLQLVESPNNTCKLEKCEPVLTRHSRFFALSLLYQSQGKYQHAIQSWVDLADGLLTDPSCPLTRSDVLELAVSTLSQLEDTNTVWEFAPWTLRNNQETGVHIFTKRPDQVQIPPEQVLALLETYPQAQIKYLEFLVHDMHSKEAGHHTLLALAYVSQSLQSQQDSGTRRKLQELLWESNCYDASTVESQTHSSAHGEGHPFGSDWGPQRGPEPAGPGLP